MRKVVNKHVLRAIKIIGTYEKTAEKLGVNRVNLSYWIRGAQPMPMKHAKTLEKATGGKVKAPQLYAASRRGIK